MKAINKCSMIWGLILFCSFTASFGQTKNKNSSEFKIKLFTGAAIPLGEFASTSGYTAGYAMFGFFVALEGSVPLSKYVEWELLSNVSINKLNASELTKNVVPYSASSGSYYSTWFLTGFQIGSYLSDDSRLYCIADIGLLFSSLPDIKYSYGDTTLVNIFESDIAVAYGIGTGFQYKDYNFSIRYLTGTAKYSQKITGNGIFKSGKAILPNSELLLMVGMTL
ncbi:MAG: hypothetical protein IPM56_11165 [Ignavibacteriales bacterium]|nr:MAG: hypothetical protein IPM56_11165 [Ignavibacteriales bacterium]